MTKIWQRLLFFEWAKVFLLFLFCFYFLYVLIDFSAHAKAFYADSLRYHDVFSYYLWQFTQRADILLPFAHLLGVVKVLTSLNSKNELVALVTSGVGLKKILKPFWCAAFLCMALLYLNFQWIQPRALKAIFSFEEKFFHDKHLKESQKVASHLFLKDGSLLLYGSFNPENGAFQDAYWIRSTNDLYRIKSLLPKSDAVIGTNVDHLVRGKVGLELAQSYDTLKFPSMRFETVSLKNASNPPRWQSITQLHQSFPWKASLGGLKKMSDREAQAATRFFYKLLFPLLCFMAIIGPSPYALRFTRNTPLFIIYALSIFGLIGLFTLLSACVILGENQVAPPLIVLLLPFCLGFIFFGRKYAKL